MMDRRARYRRVMILAFAGLAGGALATACGDDPVAPSPPPPPEPARPTSIAVEPSSATLTSLGETAVFRATVKDQRGTAFPGTVTWSSSDEAVFTVDAGGRATAVANGSGTVTATLQSLSATAAVQVAQEAASLETVSGDGQAARPGAVLPEPVVVRAVDAGGSPVEGVTVVFAAGEGHGTADPAEAVTDTAGLARTLWTLGDAEGQQTLAASVAAGPSAEIAARGLTAVEIVHAIEVVSGAGQTADLGAGLADSVIVRAVDAEGAAVEGAAVVFTPGEGHGTADPAEAFTDSEGLARTAWTLGKTVGEQTLVAVVGDVSETILAHTVNPDRAALVALYEATDGPNWVDNTNWLTDAPLGEWYGVETDVSGRVVQIDLSGRIEDGSRRPHGLSGTIPPELGNLANLEVLDLGINALTDTVPPELGNLANLKSLNLELNDLVGSIPPELGRLGNLEWLALGDNNLAGRIPPEFGELVALRLLVLRDNFLTGPIPPELGNLTNLRRLSLYRNRLSGPIPPELGNLEHLNNLNLGVNQFTGPIPTQVRNLTDLFHLDLSWNHLAGPIPPWMGTLTNLTFLHLVRNELTGPIPPELGKLVNLRHLGLGANDFMGSLPPELGKLVNLEELSINGTRMTGPTPAALLDLTKLRSFGCTSDHGFCVPGTRPFLEWIDGLESFVGSWCNDLDMAVLESLHEATGGSDWRNSAGWLGGSALREWHGVRADSLGRVTAIDLEGNDLAGNLPTSLGHLAELTELRIGDNNALTGRLPASLANLSLTTLHYAGTEVCAPADNSFQQWLNGVPSHEGTGARCAPLSERDILTGLYHETGGPKWANGDKWLSDAPLGEWNGVVTDGSGRVVGLDLSGQRLSGPIPPGLGALANLERLDLAGNNLSGPVPPALRSLQNLESLQLSWNDLSGPIPPELGTLANLERLDLAGNDLSGPIPPELRSLQNLESLRLSANDLSGPIPPELGALANLERLDLAFNDLSGPIPPELRSLQTLESLQLSWNDLSGPIPPELSTLASLEWLILERNNFSGPIPSELGGLAGLRGLRLGINKLSGSVPPELATLANLSELDLTNNTDMTGALPASLTDLRNIDAMLARGTDLCAPRDDTSFQAWLEGIADAQIASCAPSMAYLTQAVQSRVVPVPLVAGDKALLRVFVTAARGSGAGMPPIRARFYRADAETHVVYIPGTSVPIPEEIDESDLSRSANAVIPSEVVRPGLEMVIEIDPDGTLDPSLGVTERIPHKGRLAVDVREMPLFDLTVIPFVWTADPDSAVIGIAADMAADPDDHELLQQTLTLLPVAAIDVTAHDPVMSSSNSGFAVLRETEAIRVLEGRGGHYLGLMTDFSDVGGVARLGYWSSASTPFGSIIAHELGHNMSLGHAPCAVPNPDPWYPYLDGSIGAVGYDFPGEYDLVRGGGVVEEWYRDVMSYCRDPSWISDYSFNKALDHRLGSADGNVAAAVAHRTRTLLLWGGLDTDGVPYVDPAFVVDAAPTLPPAGTEYTIEGTTAGGTPLFSYSFDMPATADAEGQETSFVFALPVQTGWADELANITLSGPGGSVALDDDTDRPMAILRDPQTGQVRGFLSDVPVEDFARMAAARATAATPPLDVLISRGIPDAEAWRR